MNTRRMACFTVSPPVLESGLQLPEGHHIVGAEWDWMSRSLRIYLEGDLMPEVQEGEMVPPIFPVATVRRDDDQEMITWDFSAGSRTGNE